MPASSKVKMKTGVFVLGGIHQAHEKANKFAPYVNGTLYSVNPWRADCEQNPVSPQGGTWEFDRNGWCPGAIAVGQLVDITDAIDPGVDNEIDFDIRLANGDVYVNNDPVDWLPNELVALRLYLYGE